MPSAKYTEVYKKVSQMGEKLKAAGKQGPSNDEQLSLYAYAKVAEGKDFAAAEKPGMFNLAGKAKYNKWQEQVNAGLSQKDAEAKYVELGEQLLAKYDN
jgi:diazepam-binding inhibitor (GABA receptor modulating acyl-CoA-binding protein)